jgi:hypothetical protein
VLKLERPQRARRSYDLPAKIKDLTSLPSVRKLLPLFSSKRAAFLVSALALFLVTFSQTAAANSVTFAQFTDSGSQNFILTNNDAAGSQTLSITSPVSFMYSNIPGLPYSLQGPLPATFTLTASSNQNVGITTINGTQYAYIDQFIGSFQFTAQGSGYNGNTNLLSGTFSGQSLLLGVEGGQSATFSDSTSATNTTEVNFTSNVVDMLPLQENFALSLSSIFDTQQHDAGFNVGGPGNTDVDNFQASVTGTFASDPAPIFSDESTPFDYVVVGLIALLLVAIIRKRFGTAQSL